MDTIPVAPPPPYEAASPRPPPPPYGASATFSTPPSCPPKEVEMTYSPTSTEPPSYNTPATSAGTASASHDGTRLRGAAAELYYVDKFVKKNYELYQLRQLRVQRAQRWVDQLTSCPLHLAEQMDMAHLQLLLEQKSLRYAREEWDRMVAFQSRLRSEIREQDEESGGLRETCIIL